jgi:hypothetical protein
MRSLSLSGCLWGSIGHNRAQCKPTACFLRASKYLQGNRLEPRARIVARYGGPWPHMADGRTMDGRTDGRTQARKRARLSACLSVRLCPIFAPIVRRTMYTDTSQPGNLRLSRMCLS